MRLAEKGIVVTGASGIAAAAVRKCVAEGARVFVISIDGDECSALAEETQATGFAVADLTDEFQAESAFAVAEERLSRINGVFAVAGGSGRSRGDGPLHDTSLAGWAGTLDLNGLPMFLAAREAVRLMRGGGGSVVLVSSVLARSPVPDMFATHSYAAIKGATDAITVSLASYYAPDGIRVNTIAPGLVDTPMAARAAGDPEIVAYVRRKQPLADGLLSPDDIADAAVFLLSDESARITGQVLVVDGGWSVTEA